MSNPTAGLRNWDLVLVEWMDAFDAAAGWHDQENYKEKEVLIKTVGYYWGTPNLPEYMIIASTRGIGQVSQVTHIPLGMVRSVVKLIPKTKKAIV